ncbi:MAG: type II toxin-antitoxin system VapC family toxin [Mariniphaga sp.]|nr:type II toxin-antitoxin system VapC family toxin [Mariniphaga sp.]
MDKKLICLDTSILIDYYRKKNKAKTKFVELSKSYKFAISVITKLEILTGVRDEQRDFWTKIFSKIQIIPLQEKDVEIASEIIQSLTKRNKIIGLKDILIASTAIVNDLKIATLNIKDFERIENLKLVKE